MVEKLKDIKDELLMQAEQDMHDNGMVDPQAIDNIKDLAEAEEKCWKAEYYRSITEAMEDDGMGYSRGNRGGMGYDRQGESMQGRGYRRGYEREARRGYRGQARDSMGRYTRRGYRGRYGHDDLIGEIRQMMETADPQEKEQLKMQLRQMME